MYFAAINDSESTGPDSSGEEQQGDYKICQNLQFFLNEISVLKHVVIFGILVFEFWYYTFGI